MADQSSDLPSINDRQNEILRLEMIKTNIETRLLNARIELFKAQGGQLDFDAYEIPRKVEALIQLINDGKSKSRNDASKQGVTPTKPTSKDTSITRTTSPTLKPDINNSNPAHTNTSTVDYATNQDSFVSLKVSPARYRDLVQQRELPLASITTVQGPDCGNHPRWSNDRPDTGESDASTQLDSASATALVPSPTNPTEKVKTVVKSPPNQMAPTHENVAAAMKHTPAESNLQTTPVSATRSRSVHPHLGVPGYEQRDHYVYNHPQRAVTPYVPVSTGSGGLNSGIAISGPQQISPALTPQNNLFLQLAAMQASSSFNAPSSDRQNSSVHDNGTIPFPNVGPINWSGMKKNNKAKAANAVEKTPESPAKIPTSRKRRPSVELVDQRPRQRQREEPERVMTPPLNDVNNSRLIDENYDDSDKDEEPQSDHRPASQYATTTQKKTPAKRSAKASAKKGQQSTNYGTHYDYTGSQPMVSYSQARDNEDEDHEAYHQPAIDPEIASRQRRIDRAKLRRQPGYNKSKPRMYLASAERNTLEMRFCAQITKIIGSKICVSMSPLPYDTLPIFDRMVGRFRPTVDTPLTEEHYHTPQDFVNDATRILSFYVALGHCPECPFLKTGNARVMCYRMRLQSILEARMRDLKDCMYSCEVETEADDHAGRCSIVDEWFWEEDFGEASHRQ